MNLRRIPPVLIGTVVIAALAASVAIAATIQTYSQKFSVKHPGKSTGMTFSAKARDSSGGAPTPAKRVVLTFPAGTKINAGALPKCTNANNCPASSQLGTGKAKVFLGSVGLPFDAKVYNRTGGLLVVINNPTDPAHPVVLKPRLVGLKLILDFPKLTVGGTRAIVAEVSVTTNKVGSGARAYTTTPKSCPSNHAWTFRSQFSYEDGTSKSMTSKSACTRR